MDYKDRYFQISEKVFPLWESPGRVYHSMSHLDQMLKDIDRYPTDEITKQILRYFALFHDVVYDPKRTDNEEASVALFRSFPHVEETLGVKMVDYISSLILGTKNHDLNTEDPIARIAYELDCKVLEGSLSELLTYEAAIFKEYQFMPLDLYLMKRIEFLHQAAVRHPANSHNLLQLASIVATRKYHIGIYPGSFNPFHLGHLNILQKAEKLLDKVIVVVAVNPSKPDDPNRAPLDLPNEVVYHKGLITKLFNDYKHAEFTMVRGIRNEYDIAAEMNYRAWVDDLREGIPFVHLFCDPQFEKLSSSSIRDMRMFEDFDASKYLP